MADKLVSMKMTKSERAEKNTVSSDAPDRPIYPYGLEVRLDTDALEKLDLDELPEVGGEMTLLAKVKVTGASSSDTEYGKSRSVSLQITDLCLEDGNKDLATKLYDGGSKE